MILDADKPYAIGNAHNSLISKRGADARPVATENERKKHESAMSKAIIGRRFPQIVHALTAVSRADGHWFGSLGPMKLQDVVNMLDERCAFQGERSLADDETP